MQAAELRQLLGTKLQADDLGFLDSLALPPSEKLAFLAIANASLRSPSFPEMAGLQKVLESAGRAPINLQFLKNRGIIDNGSARNRWRFTGKLLSALSGEEIPDDLAGQSDTALFEWLHSKCDEYNQVIIDSELRTAVVAEHGIDEQLFDLMLEGMIGSGAIRIAHEADPQVIEFVNSDKEVEGETDMGRPTTWGTVQDFLGHADIKDGATQAAMNLTPKLGQVFWAALNGMEEDKGTLLPNLNLVANGYEINQLKKRDVIDRGDKRGEWLLSSEALKNMRIVIRDEHLDGQEGDRAPKQGGKTRKPKGRKSKRRAKKIERAAAARPTDKLAEIPADLRGKTLEEIVAERFDNPLAKLDAERQAIIDARAEFLKKLAD